MSENYYRDKYESLVYALESVKNELYRAREEIGLLRMQLQDTKDDLLSTKSELEPYVVSKNKSYDSFVMSGGSDICFQNGMNGNCGENCENYQNGTCENMEEVE